MKIIHFYIKVFFSTIQSFASYDGICHSDESGKYFRLDQSLLERKFIKWQTDFDYLRLQKIKNTPNSHLAEVFFTVLLLYK
jgi:hypothetical protein